MSSVMTRNLKTVTKAVSRKEEKLSSLTVTQGNN